MDENPLLRNDEKLKSSKFRIASWILCPFLLANGLHMLISGLLTYTTELDNHFCPAEPQLPGRQIKAGSWLILATIVRVVCTISCYFIFTKIYYKNNQYFTRGKYGYFICHSLLLLFDIANIGVFVYFAFTYIQMFSDTLNLEDVELWVEGEDLYCDKYLYNSALGGLVITCLLVSVAVPMLFIHGATILNIFRRFRRGDDSLRNGTELECLNAEIA